MKAVITIKREISIIIILLCNYAGLRGSITKSRVGESDRFCDAENESDRRISPVRQVFE